MTYMTELVGQGAMDMSKLTGGKPGGGSEDKPVGLAYIGLSYKGKVQTVKSYYRNVSRKWNRHYTLLRMLFEVYRLISQEENC